MPSGIGASSGGQRNLLFRRPRALTGSAPIRCDLNHEPFRLAPVRGKPGSSKVRTENLDKISTNRTG